MYPMLTYHFAERARALASSGNRGSLLYAALEIRMGVESRLQSYVQASGEVSSALKKGWQIPKLFKGLEKTFSNSSQVVEFTVSTLDAGQVVMHFIPVSAALRSHAERFGDALHVTANSHSTADWWDTLEASVLDATRDLEICGQATLLGVPLLDPEGQVHTKFEFHSSDPRLALMQSLARSKEQHRFNLSYIATEPYYARAR